MNDAQGLLADKSELERLFKSWRNLSRLRVEQKNSGSIAPPPSIHPSENSNSYQCILADTAARYRAKTARDVLYKLAFWRWSNLHIDSNGSHTNDADAVLYSAFRDLVELTGEEEVMTAFDRRTNLMRHP